MNADILTNTLEVFSMDAMFRNKRLRHSISAPALPEPSLTGFQGWLHGTFLEQSRSHTASVETYARPA